MPVTAPHNAVGWHDVEPFMERTLGHLVTQGGEPDRVNPHVRGVLHHNGARLSNPGEPSMEQDELSLRVGSDQLYQKHWRRSFNARITRMDLKWQIVFTAQFDKLP